MRFVVMMLAAAAVAAAQETKFFRLDFVVKEIEEPRVLVAKKYTSFMSTDPKQAKSILIRAGSRVPYATSATSTSFVEVGVNIDGSDLREAGSQLTLWVQSEISSVPATEGPLTSAPIIRQNRWSSMVVVEPGKPTTLFSSDDLNSKRKLQLELTATPVK